MSLYVLQSHFWWVLLECNQPKLPSKKSSQFQRQVYWFFLVLIFMPKMEDVDAVHTFTRAGFLLQTELLLALRFCCLLGTKAAKSTLFVFKPHYFSIEEKSVNAASLISNCEMKLSLNFLIIRYLNMTVTSCFLAKPVRDLIPHRFLGCPILFFTCSGNF